MHTTDTQLSEQQTASVSYHEEGPTPNRHHRPLSFGACDDETPDFAPNHEGDDLGDEKDAREFDEAPTSERSDGDAEKGTCCSEEPPDCADDSAQAPTPEGRHNIDLGARGELAASRFLERRGMTILERNWTCFAGEADIIALDDEALHFVEVKTRSNTGCGFPSEAVNQAKRERYERIAVTYLSQSDICETAVMFDIISIVVTGADRAVLRYHHNAFAGCE